MSGSRAFKHAARRLHARDVVEHAFDSTRLVIDSLSDPVYQPVAELGRRYVKADRGIGTMARWSEMRPVIDGLGVKRAADVGCNAGWFVLELGRLGIEALGIEAHPPYYRAAITAARRSGLGNIGIMAAALTPETMGLLPAVDCIIFLSVWHHLVREEGIEPATRFLKGLWGHTNVVMFFESGESEEFRTTDFGLPEMAPDAQTWLARYLAETCGGSEIVQLGRHPSGPGSNATRNLFAVKRVVPGSVKG